MIGWHKTQILLLPWFPAKNKTPALTYSIQCKCPNWSQPTCSGKYNNNNNHMQILMDKAKTENPQKKWMNLNLDFRKFFRFFDSSLVHHISRYPQHFLEFPSPCHLKVFYGHPSKFIHPKYTINIWKKVLIKTIWEEKKNGLVSGRLAHQVKLKY